MNVFVTGATSFIGRASVDQLLEAGCQVTAVVRPGSPGRRALEEMEGVEVVSLNLSEISALPGLLGREGKLGQMGECAWLHLGWEGAGSDNRRNPELQRKNIGYALDSLETAARLDCGRFLFSGSQAEYGICEGVMREDMECRPVSQYGKMKTEVLKNASLRAAELGLAYLHTRIFSVYGPGDHPWSLVETCLDKFLAGESMELGPCTQIWNFLYVEDAARALVQLLLGKGPAGVYNVAGEDTRPLRSYIEEIYELCGRKGSYVYGTRPPNAEGTVSLRPDITRLKEAAHFCPQVSFHEGIGRMIRLREEKRSEGEDQS